MKDAVTKPDLTNYDLAAPQHEIILRSKAGDTNAVIAELDFGAVQTNGIFVRRPDENFVYAVKEQDFNLLPDTVWEFRNRRIWNFSVDDVAQITIHQDGKTRQIVHNGPGKWSLAAGSQGFIEDKYIEQAVEMFHQLFAVGWVAHNFAGPEIGIYTNSLQITFELKNGEKDAVDFGAEYRQKQTALAGITLDGERWGFVLPPALFQLASIYLTIPLNVP